MHVYRYMHTHTYKFSGRVSQLGNPSGKERLFEQYENGICRSKQTNKRNTRLPYLLLS